MARYTITNRDGHFVGWDSLVGRSNEATHAEHLGRRLTDEEKIRFRKLSPGQRWTSPWGVKYFREY